MAKARKGRRERMFTRKLFEMKASAQRSPEEIDLDELERRMRERLGAPAKA